MRRWSELAYFILLLHVLFKINLEKRRELLTESEKLAELMDRFQDEYLAEVDKSKDDTTYEKYSAQFRYMLLFILFPEEHERVFSHNHRLKIVKHFRQNEKLHFNALSNIEIDSLLRGIRKDLESNDGNYFDFYKPPLNEWNKDIKSQEKKDKEPASSSLTSETSNTKMGEAINLIYYGPPGTGKTYHLNKLINEDYLDRNKFVTFHQSYSYEDFVEGLRPESDDDGNITFKVKPGIFRQICELAKEDSNNRYALMIDEINRGNIAKIFGELITLIEADKRDGAENATSAILPYSSTVFTVPSNLDIFGTMNTADRSIALLDKALRRRFQFRELMPNTNLIEGVNGNGQIEDGEKGHINLRELLDTMNKRIRFLLNRDLTLGHAYLNNVRNFDDLREVFIYRFIPLLQEYFYDDWHKIQLIFKDIDHEGKAIEPQIIKHEELDRMDILGIDHDEFDDGIEYDIARNDEITAKSIRKIYEPPVVE